MPSSPVISAARLAARVSYPLQVGQYRISTVTRATLSTAVRPRLRPSRGRVGRSGFRVRTALATIGIDVVAVKLDEAVAANLGHAEMDIIDGGFGIDYPDGAGLLSRVVHTALPPEWRPPGLDADVDRLDRLSGKARADAAAASLYASRSAMSR
jgi:hypothetical protein